MYEEDKNFPNIILVLFTSVMFLCLTIVGVFFIGVVKVDAQVPDYNWNSPRLMGISTSDSILDESSVLASSTNSNSVTYSSNVWGGTNVYIRYRVVDSDVGTTYMEQGTYSFSYKATFTLIGTNSIAKITPKLLYYPNAASTYGTATCDTTPVMILTQTGVDPTTYDFTYSCNTFNVTTDVSWFAVGFSVSIPINYVSMAQNLKFAGPSDTQDIINNQNQNTQDIINNNNANTDKITDSVDKNTESIDKNTEEQKETNDTLKDSDTTGAQDTAGGFFDSFTTEDNGGISGIITAPLVAINQMLSETCVDLTGSYKGKEFSIPNGCEFWSKIPEVKNFLNVIEGGLLCYLIIRKMFYLVQRLKNPEDDRVEVMSL